MRTRPLVAALRRLSFAAGVALLAAAPACSDDTETDPPEATPFVAATQSATVDAAGGSLELTASDGTRYTLTIPPGALVESTEVSLTTREPVGDERFHVVVGPAGLLLEAGTAASLTVALPEGDELGDEGGLALDGALVPFTRNADRSVTMELRSLWAPPTMKPLSLVTVATCGAPTVSTQGVTGADTVDLALYAQCMSAAIDQLDRTGQFDDAVRASLAVAALLQRIGGNGAGDAQTYIDAANVSACAGRGAAFDLAAGTSVLSLGDFHSFLRPMAYWEAIVQGLGASCAGQATFSEAAGALTDKALALYDANRPMMQDAGGALYQSTLGEARDGRQVRREVSALAPPAPLAAAVDAQIVDRAEKKLVDVLLDGPFRACRDSGDFAPLMAVMDALGAPDAAKDVAQYCGTAIHAEAFDAGAASLGTAGPLGDASRGDRKTTATLRAAPDGHVKLSGVARALSCPAGYESEESLTITLNDQTVLTLPGPDYLGATVDLDIAEALSAAGIDPASPGDGQTLTFTRDGDACQGYWGENPSPLASLELRFGAPRIMFSSGGNPWSLGVVDADGTDQAPFPIDGLGPDLIEVAWAPDGAHFAVNHPVDIGGGWVIGKIHVVAADGSSFVNVSPSDSAWDTYPSFSPDGSRIVFSSQPVPTQTSATRIWVMNADGTNRQKLTTELSDTPQWSPDGAHILFFRQSGLSIMNPDGTGVQTLAPQGSYGTWSADGTHVIVLGNGASGYGFYELDLAGSTVGFGAFPSGLSLGDGFGIAPSPDGTKLAFPAFHFGAGELPGIYVMNLDGSNVLKVTDETSVCGYPAWTR